MFQSSPPWCWLAFAIKPDFSPDSPGNLAEVWGSLDPYTRAASAFDPSTSIVLGVALVISTAAYLTMRQYVRSVDRESRSQEPTAGSEVEVGTPPPPTTIVPLEIQIEKPAGRGGLTHPRSPTFRHAETAFLRAACFYALGGSISAAATAGLLFLFGFYSVPSTPSRLTLLACYAGVFLSWSFFTFVEIALFCGPDRRLRGLLWLVYIAIFPAVGVLLEIAGAPRLRFADAGPMSEDDAIRLLFSLVSQIVGQPITPASVTFSPHLQPILFWTLSAAPMLIPLLAFNRYIRGTVGPLFVNLTLMMLLSTFFINDLALSTAPGVWLVAHLKSLSGGFTFAILTTISLALSAIVAWFGLVWIAGRYRNMKLSDQTFLFDALWLAVSCWVSVYLFKSDQRFLYLLGLGPFVLYKIAVGPGLKWLTTRAEPLPNARLLFLRVFGSPSRSEKLFDLLAARWRYAGSIHLISAGDVARARFEPDEFLDFVNRRLANAYINNHEDLDRRLAGLRLRPDPDGRYRVNEFFCRENAWRLTIRRLMAQSDLVTMDLRGFTSENEGCIFELRTLVDEVPLHRVALLIDQTTDEPCLRQTLVDLCREMNSQSPNAAAGIARLRMIDLACGYPTAVDRLLQIGDELVAQP